MANGDEIEPEKGADFFHFSIHNDGKLANVAMFVWFSKHPKFKGIERYVFSEYLKGRKVKPSSHVLAAY